ncbi:unannotated protein [freshwater metagenome]|uniref:Unannotated protein n=1 Tax=freshwater metagenome TaxID=449393 RepID=A0A6J7QMN4_9ZZZZ
MANTASRPVTIWIRSIARNARAPGTNIQTARHREKLLILTGSTMKISATVSSDRAAAVRTEVSPLHRRAMSAAQTTMAAKSSGVIAVLVSTFRSLAASPESHVRRGPQTTFLSPTLNSSAIVGDRAATSLKLRPPVRSRVGRYVNANGTMTTVTPAAPAAIGRQQRMASVRTGRSGRRVRRCTVILRVNIVAANNVNHPM